MFRSKEHFFRFVARCWFYFRRGYGLYLSFLVGFASYLSVLYFLLVQSLFPDSLGFYRFILLIVVALVPLGVFIGWLDLRRTPLYGAEAEISTEQNPYVHRLVPGKEVLFAKTSFQMNLWLMRYLEEKGVISEDEKKKFVELLNRYQQLIKGESL